MYQFFTGYFPKHSQIKQRNAQINNQEDAKWDHTWNKSSPSRLDQNQEIIIRQEDDLVKSYRLLKKSI